MKKTAKRIFYTLLLVLTIILIINFQLVVYGLEQGYGQLKIVYKAEPISEVLKDKNIPDSIKQKLVLIQEIKKFAEDSLGINKSENYQNYYDQQGKPAIWVITASDPFELKAYEWNFPFLGSVSYKGFFNKKRGVREEKALKDKGFDTDLGTATGWSTLGWFKDPVLSGMLKRKEGSLASLIIHELTHGTLFIKDSVDYNENLANFVGDKGAIEFLKYKYGINSHQLLEYEQNKEDRERYINHILRGSQKLDSLFDEIRGLKDIDEKKKQKKMMIRNIIHSLDTINFYKKAYYRSSTFDLDSINNTFFIDFKRYNSKQTNFEEEYKKKFHSNLKAYLKYLKTKYSSV